MFGPAQANTLRTKIQRNHCFLWGLSIGAHFHSARLVSPLHHCRKSSRHFGLNRINLSIIHLAASAIDGDYISLTKNMISDKHLAANFIEPDVACSRYTRPPHAPRNNRCMACHAATGCENTSRRMHSMNILRTGLKPDKNNLFAARSYFFSPVSIKHNFATCRTR